MNVIETSLNGALVIEPDVFGDHRGFFIETYSRKRYEDHGIQNEFVQDNISQSSKNIVRGLHYQLNHPQSKLVQVLKGEIYDVAVDIRVGSPQFGQWMGVVLSESNKKQLYIPVGFAHGFCVLSDYALFHYKCSDYYDPDDEFGVLWNDSNLGISWPVDEPVLSDRDCHYKRLGEISDDVLPLYKGGG